MTKQKTSEERLKECLELRKQINRLGVEVLPEIESLFPIMNDFIRNGTSASGKIQIPSISRVAEYLFSNKPYIVSTLVLKYNPPANYYNFNLP
jgi:hypothetical protein